MPEKKPEPKRPPYPGTRLRPFRLSDSLYEEAREIAKARGENLTAHVVRPAFERYVKRHRPK